jgi:hypothetical protein
VTRYNECLQNPESILRQANMQELETVGCLKKQHAALIERSVFFVVMT